MKMAVFAFVMFAYIFQPHFCFALSGDSMATSNFSSLVSFVVFFVLPLIHFYLKIRAIILLKSANRKAKRLELDDYSSQTYYKMEGQDPIHQDQERDTVYTDDTIYYEILSIPYGASRDEVRAAYLKRAQECHPDKVASLGQEFKDLAQIKFTEAQGAYAYLDAKLSQAISEQL